MMELAMIILRQIILMFLYMMTGFFLYKKKLVTKEGSKELGHLLLYVILPTVIINAYMVPFSHEAVKGLMLSCLASLLALLLSMFLSRLVFGGRRPVEEFSSAFSNAGFIGIPLVEMTFDNSMVVFYVSSFVAVLNILQWTYGIFVMTGKKDSIALKKIVTNPVVLSFILGILLFVLPLELPEVINRAAATVSAMNAPMAMIILGIYLAQMKVRELITDLSVWICALIRLIVIPLATAVLLKVLPGEEMLKMSVLIVASTPVGSNVAVFAQMENLDYTQAVKDICLSTVLCLLTIPVIVTAAGYIL